MLRRNTIQKEIVLDTVRALKSHVSADEVYNVISCTHPSIGKGTVYRNLNLLADEGLIKKIKVSDGADRFDFTITDHFHMQCKKCGNIFDVKMASVPDLKAELIGEDELITDYDLLFKGICHNCKNN